MTVPEAFRIFPTPLKNFLTSLTRVIIMPGVIHCRQHHPSDNKQPYNHAVKLPDDGFKVIRLFRYSAVSGSVPRQGNKQSGVFRCAALGHPGHDKTQHMGCRPDWKATKTTIYGLQRPLRAGADEEDPGPGVFGSERRKNHKRYNYVLETIKSYQVWFFTRQDIIRRSVQDG